MSWTKREFVLHAYEEIGYADYAYDLQPEQLEAALNRLDSMMATWNGRTIRLGYPIPSNPKCSDLDEQTDVPDIANEAIYLNLALRIAPIVGKQVSVDTRISARQSYMELAKRAARPNEMKLPQTTPAGQGSKPWRHRGSPFLRQECDGVITQPDNEVDFNAQ